tara:strand:+ start:343 stop:942 length:600 start_codon:yes stop_codon:yes gene_type:complete
VDLNYNVQNIFPVSIHQFQIKDFDGMKGKLIDYVYDLKKQDPVGKNISSRHGWQSLLVDLSKDNDLFRNFLIDCVSDLPFISKKTSFTIDTWININKTGSYNIKHCHPTSHLSGVLWLKCPEECGEIVFTSPYEFMGFAEHQLYSDEFKKSYGSYLSYYFTPDEGTMILFPSHLVHHVNENKSDEDRISISFNMIFNDI